MEPLSGCQQPSLFSPSLLGLCPPSFLSSSSCPSSSAISSALWPNQLNLPFSNLSPNVCSELSSPALPQARERLETVSVCLQNAPHCFLLRIFKQFKLQGLGILSGVPCNTQSVFARRQLFITLSHGEISVLKESTHKTLTAAKTRYHSLAWSAQSHTWEVEGQECRVTTATQ